MNDLISRQVALDALGEAPEVWMDSPEEFAALNQWEMDVTAIEAVPSAEPEIVRCKDCKYMTEHYDTDGNVPYWTCSEWDAGTDYDGFCHYAERRTDGSD